MPRENCTLPMEIKPCVFLAILILIAMQIPIHSVKMSNNANVISDVKFKKYSQVWIHGKPGHKPSDGK